MSGKGHRVTTGEAADIVCVHESTVKRWCDAGELQAELTEGGHRRIALQSLLAYARAVGLECSLLSFGADAERAYGARGRAIAGDFKRVAGMVYRKVRGGNSESVTRLIRYLLDSGLRVDDIMDQSIAPVMHGIGRQWSSGKLAVGEEHRMTYVIFDAIYQLRNELPRPKGERRAVVGCLAGNRHEVGANMVRITLEANGWEVIYLGGDVPAQDFAHQQLRSHSALVCISLTAPQVAVDARRIAEGLARLHRADQPFRLALGGQPLEHATLGSLEGLPFDDVRSFDSLRAFSEWL